MAERPARALGSVGRTKAAAVPTVARRESTRMVLCVWWVWGLVGIILWGPPSGCEAAGGTKMQRDALARGFGGRVGASGQPKQQLN